MSRPLGEIDLGFQPTGCSEWDSVYYVLTAPCIRRDAAPFIDVRRQSINWTGLRRAGRVWGHGGRLLLALAQNLWNSTGHPSVREMVDTFDDENFARAMRAIRIARGGRPGSFDGSAGVR